MGGFTPGQVLLSWRASFYSCPRQAVALTVPTGAVGATAAGAGAACTDQALQAGHSFLLQPLPEGAGSNLVWSRNSPCTEQPVNFKEGGSFCLSRGPGGLYFVPARDSAPAEFGTVSSSKIHISAEYRFQANRVMHGRVSQCF